MALLRDGLRHADLSSTGIGCRAEVDGRCMNLRGGRVAWQGGADEVQLRASRREAPGKGIGQELSLPPAV